MATLRNFATVACRKIRLRRTPKQHGSSSWAELATRYDLTTAIDGLRREMENQTLRLTVRLGIMLAAGLSILAAIQRLH
ncbi:MAG TPA: hypothetical protein VG651_24100 [Stellaceae bacterium]|nr:hypothetical protein [Stellaceae bacterium]